MRNVLSFAAIAVTLCVTAVAAHAHDTWVQTNTNLVRVGDAIHADLCLGNHGNTHRDFKLAGKLADLSAITINVIAPDGSHYDLRDRLSDVGYTPQEGYWTGAFVPAKPGIYCIAQTFDSVMSYAPERSIKSAKTYFVADKSLDKPKEKPVGSWSKPIGSPLELVPVSNPVLPMGPGTALNVRLLYKGKPLAGTKIAFIPRGATLTEGTDPRYEKSTDAKGEASLTLTEANTYLIVAHREEKNEAGTLAGKPYSFTQYAATMTVYVPKVCPCCGE